MSSAFLSLDDPRWRCFLATTSHDVYHLPEYARAVAAHEDGVPCAFYGESGDAALLVPLLVRRLPDRLGDLAGLEDLTGPYGYPAPLFSGRRDERSVDRLLHLFRSACRDRGYVSAFLRLHPLIRYAEASFAAHGDLVATGPTVYLDLRQPEQAQWHGVRPRVRTAISRLRRTGYTALLDDWSRFDAFVRIYRETMERVGAAAVYRFPDEYFRDLRAQLGDALHLCVVLTPEQETAAAGLFFETGGIVQYHLGGTANDALPVGPARLMFDEVRLWATSCGHRYLHLGGGVGGAEDSLFRFKAGFSPGRARFATFRMVIDPGRYEAAVLRWRTVARPAADTGQFFPAYRA